jgi:pimeloyl-ACP methyl ester carboxylesterase
LLINCVDAFIKDIGTGPPVYFLHGNPDSADVWNPVIGRIKDRYRCIAPDLPGFGRSKIPEDYKISFDSMTGFCGGVLEKAGIMEPVILVVHDFGGPHGLAWAVKNPEKVKKIVCINTLFQADYRWHFWARVWRTPILGELSVRLMNKTIFGIEMRRGSKKLSSRHISETWNLTSPSMWRMVLKLYKAVDPEKLAEWEKGLLELARKIPVMVLWGIATPTFQKKWPTGSGPARSIISGIAATGCLLRTRRRFQGFCWISSPGD